jgi:hypothetical protein
LSASTVPAAKAKVLELLDSIPAPKSWTEPVKDDDFREANIWLGESVEQEEVWKALGGELKEETYSFDVVCQVWDQNGTAQQAEVAAWALREQIALILRQFKELEGVLNLWTEVEGTTTRTGPTTKGFLSRATLRITCRARI